MALFPRVRRFVAVVAIFTLLAVFLVALRLVARIVLLKNGGRDEVAIIASLICAIGALVASLEEVKYGLGTHVQDVAVPDLINQLKGLYAVILFYNASLALTKFSIVLQYLRVFVGRRIRIACWTAIGVIVVYGLETILLSIFSCTPISGFWDVTIPSHCIERKFEWFFHAAFNIFTDFVVLGLPIPILMKLQFPMKQKILLMFVFALGGFTCIISVLRLHSLYVLAVSTDPTYDNLETGMWSLIEVNAAIICASLQTLRPVIARLLPRIFTSSSGPTKPSQNSALRMKESKGHSQIIELNTISKGNKNITAISKGEPKENEYYDLGDRRMVIEVDKDILVATSTTMYGESKSENGSENELILHKP